MKKYINYITFLLVKKNTTSAEALRKYVPHFVNNNECFGRLYLELEDPYPHMSKRQTSLIKIFANKNFCLPFANDMDFLPPGRGGRILMASSAHFKYCLRKTDTLSIYQHFFFCPLPVLLS